MTTSREEILDHFIGMLEVEIRELKARNKQLTREVRVLRSDLGRSARRERKLLWLIRWTRRWTRKQSV